MWQLCTPFGVPPDPCLKAHTCHTQVLVRVCEVSLRMFSPLWTSLRDQVLESVTRWVDTGKTWWTRSRSLNVFVVKHFYDFWWFLCVRSSMTCSANSIKIVLPPKHFEERPYPKGALDKRTANDRTVFHSVVAMCVANQEPAKCPRLAADLLEEQWCNSETAQLSSSNVSQVWKRWDVWVANSNNLQN